MAPSTSSSTGRPSETAPQVEMVSLSNSGRGGGTPKTSVEVSGREVTGSGDLVSRTADGGPSKGQGRQLSPVEDLKQRLSMWGESSSRSPYGGEDEEAGSEYELLLDPNLPDE